jgi:hypothetical protein
MRYKIREPADDFAVVEIAGVDVRVGIEFGTIVIDIGQTERKKLDRDVLLLDADGDCRVRVTKRGFDVIGFDLRARTP